MHSERCSVRAKYLTEELNSYSLRSLVTNNQGLFCQPLVALTSTSPSLRAS